MDSKLEETQTLTKDAFLAFNRIGGQIKSRSLEILRKRLNEEGENVADIDDVQRAYWEACHQILEPK